MSFNNFDNICINVDFSTKRSLSQHFLSDLSLARLIVKNAGPFNCGTIIEIGPGLGILTQALLLEGASNIISVEKDYRCCNVLQSLVRRFPDRLLLLEANALDLDFFALGPPPYRIVSNLPYNISTALLVSWLKLGIVFQSLTLMFQKEVATRLFAVPNSKCYSRLSIITQFSCIGCVLFDVLPEFFIPSPKVLSSVVRLLPNKDLIYSRYNSLEDISKITKILFSQRRKMLRVNLKFFTSDPIKLLFRAKISSTLRAENLQVDDFDLLLTLIKGLSK